VSREGAVTEPAGAGGKKRSWVERGDLVALRLGHAEMAIAALLIVGSLGISLYTIVTRALLVTTGEWVLQLPLELVALGALFGAGGLIAADGHIRVEFVVARLPPRAAAFVRTGVSVSLGALCLFLASRGVVVTRQAMMIHLTIPEIFDLPMSLPAAVGTAAIFLWALHFLWLAVRR
jgi:TRAP-type C4-dicarboxylate transport system permease small subunit